MTEVLIDVILCLFAVMLALGITAIIIAIYAMVFE